jgi:hypothetical protein
MHRGDQRNAILDGLPRDLALPLDGLGGGTIRRACACVGYSAQRRGSLAASPSGRAASPEEGPGRPSFLSLHTAQSPLRLPVLFAAK